MRRALLVAQLVVMLLIARNWAYVTTYRLYLDHRVGAADRSSAAQQFDIERSRVVPQIVTRGPDRLSFATDVRQDSTVRVELRPARRTTYEIAWHDANHRRVLAAGAVEATTPIVADYPGGSGVIELASDSAVAWVDPRVVRGFNIRPHLIALALLAVGVAFSRREPRSTRPVWRMALLTASVIVSCVAAEAGLRALGDSAPGGVLTERHDLGEVTRDPRWMDSSRYGRRLRAESRRHQRVAPRRHRADGIRAARGERRHPPPLRVPDRRRGFSQRARARTVRHRRARRLVYRRDDDGGGGVVAVAAGEATGRRRCRTTARPVLVRSRNGSSCTTSSLQHRPRVVVLAYFAGNDLFDAEAFDEFQRSGVEQREAPGWRIKEVVSRADTWFITSALRASIRWAREAARRAAAAAAAEPHEPPRSPAQRRCGVRSRDVLGADQRPRVVRFAFMPPYLNTLNFSESDLRARAGWTSYFDGDSRHARAVPFVRRGVRRDVRAVQEPGLSAAGRACVFAPGAARRLVVLPGHLRAAGGCRCAAPQSLRPERVDAAASAKPSTFRFSTRPRCSRRACRRARTCTFRMNRI